jgi:hypothetical protein
MVDIATMPTKSPVTFEHYKVKLWIEIQTKEHKQKSQTKPASGNSLHQSWCVYNSVTRAFFGDSPAADDCRKPPISTSRDLEDKLWPSRVGSRNEIPGACWPRAEQRRPTRPWLEIVELEEAGDHNKEACVMKDPVDIFLYITHTHTHTHTK